MLKLTSASACLATLGLLVVSAVAAAQSANTLDYRPLGVGDRWFYESAALEVEAPDEIDSDSAFADLVWPRAKGVAARPTGYRLELVSERIDILDDVEDQTARFRLDQDDGTTRELSFDNVRGLRLHFEQTLDNLSTSLDPPLPLLPPTLPFRGSSAQRVEFERDTPDGSGATDGTSSSETAGQSIEHGETGTTELRVESRQLGSQVVPAGSFDDCVLVRLQRADRSIAGRLLLEVVEDTLCPDSGSILRVELRSSYRAGRLASSEGLRLELVEGWVADRSLP